MANQEILAQLAELVAQQQIAVPVDGEMQKTIDAGVEKIEGVGMFGMTCVLIGLVCMAVSTIHFYRCAMRAKGSNFFEVLSMMITGIATLAYLTMYSGSGYSWIYELQEAGKDKPGEIDPFYWARYIDWILTTPLMLWDVLALAGATSDDILCAVFIDMLMIGFGCVGAQTPFSMRWLFFIVSMLCFVHVVQVLLKYNKSTKNGEAAQKLYQKLSALTIVLWSFYPLVWVVAEGTRMISPSLEACCYMIMDVISKCLFGFMIVSARSTLEEATEGYQQM
jgi:bacteriorhodopsin